MDSLYEKVVLPEMNEEVGTGWLPPMPDLRDYTIETKEVQQIVKKLGLKGDKIPKALPGSVDLRQWCSPVENQGALGSCTANAAAGVVEYYERRAFGRHINASRLFIYKATRDLMRVTGDTGAWLRNTMGALTLAGVAPEKYWPYDISKFDVEPPAFVYAVADNYEALRYFCHDPIGQNISKATVLARVKLYLAYGIPSMFGFFGFDSFNHSNVRGGIPFPCPGERAKWGHAIVAVGYDDNKKIKNTRCNKTTKGAFLIRNSWGAGWGDHGYGWLPYEYVLHGFARDFWSMLKMEWVDTKKFGL
ncbi:C1 family peptidase [Hydrogenimonas sp.]